MKRFIFLLLITPLAGFAMSRKSNVVYKPFSELDSIRRTLVENFIKKSCSYVPAGAIYEEFLSTDLADNTRSPGIESRRHEFLIKVKGRVIDHLHFIISENLQMTGCGMACEPTGDYPPPEYFDAPDIWIERAASTKNLCR
jgi:hypothetical protein